MENSTNTIRKRNTHEKSTKSNIKHEMKIEKNRKIQLILKINKIVYIDETILYVCVCVCCVLECIL